MPEGAHSGQAPVLVELRSLLPADSPRFEIDPEHVSALAESEVEFPPILVHRPTMRVVDGMHRLRATMLRGRHTIAAQWFDGDEQTAFLLAVESNMRHGLPLSREERRRATLRILRSHPDWSDRSIAEMTGLNARSVGELRRRSAVAGSESLARIGRDGRVRPPSTTAGRFAAAEVIRQNPAASLRDIARQAGISVGTARDVRQRLASGLGPIPDRTRKGDPAGSALVGAGADRTDPGGVPDLAHRITIFDGLRRDPSIRLSESGRRVLHQLRTQLHSTEEWKRLAPAIPSHGRNAVADILSACAEDLIGMAQQLRRREESVAG
ncbi:ParB/RepB/Spo0J family partition protein [Micromonospora sp. WMMD882]|uniref:ParB/RepB/Spo0J family partition protein n=1 Tax=Micromonospora sp. WMMD882 TaxID=3015151 RepID=UPI00248CB499|nr:ParB/RepB/Spo0J family partition protein [Micromonospora sp. WMMD882]WBB81244.1 ParB/RepB/Spo0J family partition protein [Micromonospora sp. WMMD882]